MTVLQARPTDQPRRVGSRTSGKENVGDAVDGRWKATLAARRRGEESEVERYEQQQQRNLHSERKF